MTERIRSGGPRVVEHGQVDHQPLPTARAHDAPPPHTVGPVDRREVLPPVLSAPRRVDIARDPLVLERRVSQWARDPKGPAPEGLFSHSVSEPLFQKAMEKVLGKRPEKKGIEQNVYDLMLNQLLTMRREQGANFDPANAEQFGKLAKLGDSEMGKVKKHLKALTKAGVFAQMPRQATDVQGGTMTHYQVGGRGALIEGRGHATVDKGKLANLAQFESATGGPSLIRHAKVESVEQWDAVRRLAARRITGEMAQQVASGDQLAPAIFRYDLKTPSTVFGNGEHAMVKRERETADQSNAENPDLPKVHYISRTANVWSSGLVHSAVLSSRERAISEPAMRNKGLRALIELARSEGEGWRGMGIKEVQKLTQAFNKFERTGDQKAFEEFLTAQSRLNHGMGTDKGAFYNHLLGISNGAFSLSKMGDFMRHDLTDVTSSKGQAIRDSLTAVLTGENARGKSLSRAAELAMHTALDQHINVDSDIGCKSGQDRTLHLFAASLAGRGLREGFGEPVTTNFLQNFDALAESFDRAEDPAWYQRIFSNSGSRERDFDALARKSGLDPARAREMMTQYRQSYYDAAVKVGLPMTTYSTLLPGMKWHGTGAFSENRLPTNYMPKRVRLADGSWQELMETTAPFGRRHFTPLGGQVVKGLGKYRSS